MQTASRLIAASLLVALSQLLVLGIHRGSDPQRSPLPTLTPDNLPGAIGDFEGRDEPLDERLVAGSDADVMINKVYRNRLGDFVIANLGVWCKYEKTIPHSPEICYTRAGWEIASRKQLQVSAAGRPPWNAKLFIFQRHTTRIAVAFWVQLDDEVMIDSEGIRKIRQRLRSTGGNLPPLVKVMLQTEAVDLDQAEARLTRFAASLSPFTLAVR